MPCPYSIGPAGPILQTLSDPDRALVARGPVQKGEAHAMDAPPSDAASLVPDATLAPARSVRRWVILSVAALALFLVGRALAPHSIDFGVYHRAAESLLEGRTDLYSTTFALKPPMRYVYPPLFVLLVAPLGLLEFTDAFGLWFALLGLATLFVTREAVRAWAPRAGWGRKSWLYGLAALLIAGPAVIYGLRSANVHLLLVLMTVAAVVAWGRGATRSAAVLIALAGAIKIFPLFLVPAFLALREWRLLARVAALSVILWALPLAWFGPGRALALYDEWRRDVGGNVERLRLESRLDVSLESATQRWLSRVDYGARIDPRYPQVNLVSLDPRVAHSIGHAAVAVLVALSGLVLLKLGFSMADPVSRATAAGSLFASAQLLTGPYTTLLYLSAWLLPALALPAAAAIQQPIRARLRLLLLALGVLNLALVLVPGSADHRALEALGVHTGLSLALWTLAAWVAWRFPRRRLSAGA